MRIRSLVLQVEKSAEIPLRADIRSLEQGKRLTVVSSVGVHTETHTTNADELTRRGAIHHPAANFTENVIIDGRLVTGQNPQSATGVGEAMVKVLGSRK